MKEEKFDVERLTKITAYHEASHFVLALLMNKFDSSFEKPSKATIKVMIGEPYGGQITTNIPGVRNKGLANDEVLRRKQVFGRCFVLLAGYYSYNIFCDGCGNCIMETTLPKTNPPKTNSENILTKDCKMESFTLEEKLNDICHPFYNKENHDIKRTINLLKDLWKYSGSRELDGPFGEDKLRAIIPFLFNELKKLMGGETAVKDSIELVKNQLLKNNGNVIEGRDLNDLIANVEGFIVNIDITKYLDACEKAYRNDDWYAPPTFPLPPGF